MSDWAAAPSCTLETLKLNKECLTMLRSMLILDQAVGQSLNHPQSPEALEYLSQSLKLVESVGFKTRLGSVVDRAQRKLNVDEIIRTADLKTLSQRVITVCALGAYASYLLMGGCTQQNPLNKMIPGYGPSLKVEAPKPAANGN